MAIKILDKALAAKIAAGEVIERPESVLKELLENSLDSGATSISVLLAEGGKRLIRVSDNGCGMSMEDASLAFARHATSKISTEEDLGRILTMGFRGEALSSISAVSRVVLKTRQKGDVAGAMVEAEGVEAPLVSVEGCPEGTTIEVRDLFFNTPARLKFLRSADSEWGKALEVFKKIALVNPEKRFRIAHGSGRVIEAPPGTPKERISDLFGPEYARGAVEVKTPDVSGFIGSHDHTFPTARALYIYVNGRWVRDRSINRAVIDGYGQMLGPGRYPFALLDLKVPPEDVDVNIHPTKSEVRFKNPAFVYDVVKYAVRAALSTAAPKAKGEPYPRPVSAPAPSLYEATAAYTSSSVQLELTGAARGAEGAKNPEFLGLSVIGQLWGEFLLAQTSERSGDFYLIDQHGAAERAAFERLKKGYQEGAVKSQLLLLPERFETTPEGRDSIKEAGEYLKRMGFDLVPFGPSIKAGGETFLIKAVPSVLASIGCAGLVQDLSEELSSYGGSARVEERVEEALMRIACHSVIRGPRPLTSEEAKALLGELASIDFAAYCPHGRPVVKKISRAEIEAIFKR